MKHNHLFIDEKGSRIDFQNVERIERRLCNRYIPKDAVVLELGARYGTVSFVINSKLDNKSNHVAVEPDPTVWDVLNRNRDRTGCQFHILKGFISNKKWNLNRLPESGYFTHTVALSENEVSDIPSFTLSEVKEKYGLDFNTLVCDCEGFLETFLDENPDLLLNLKLLIMECDSVQRCNYDKIRENLSSAGFSLIERKYYHEVWRKSVSESES